MKKEQFMMNGLHAVIWQPDQNAKAILQITHGMTEHMGRYETLAADLCSQGIAVAGFDLRGHGRNPGDPQIASFGTNGWETTIDNGDENVIESFKGNKITVNSTSNTKRAAFKVWDDETYASNDEATDVVNTDAQAFINAVLADGSNIFNILFIVGLSGLVIPVPFVSAFRFDTLIAATAALLLLVLALPTKRLGRVAGIIMLAGYVAYFAMIW